MSFPYSRGVVDLSAFSVPPAGAQTAQDTHDKPAASLVVESLVGEGTDENFSYYAELSMQVPIIVDLWATWCEPCKQLTPALTRVVESYAGRFLLVTVDVDTNPQLAQVFQAQSVPTVVAIIGGQPAPLFAGAIPEDQIREVLEQVDQIATQSGITARVTVSEQVDHEQAPQEEPLSELHVQAQEYLEDGNYDQAITAYKTAIAQKPGDSLAVSQLARVYLLKRIATADSNQIDQTKARQDAAAEPNDLDAQLCVADFDLFAGHVEDACGRLLDLFPTLPPEGKEQVRVRLVEYFEVLGAEDIRVAAIRRRLTSLIY